MEKDLYSQKQRCLEKSRYILIDMKTLRVDLLKTDTKIDITPLDITDSISNSDYDKLADILFEIAKDFKNNL